MNCAHCERVVKNLEGYCAKQKPMGDLDLKCFDCTWAHHEMPGCAAIMPAGIWVLSSAPDQPRLLRTIPACAAWSGSGQGSGWGEGSGQSSGSG